MAGLLLLAISISDDYLVGQDDGTESRNDALSGLPGNLFFCRPHPRCPPRGTCPDIPVYPHPPCRQVVAPLGALPVPRRRRNGRSHCASIRTRGIYPGQTHPVGRPTRRRSDPLLLSAGRVDCRFGMRGPDPAVFPRCRPRWAKNGPNPPRTDRPVCRSRRGCRPPPLSTGRCGRTCRGSVCPFRLRRCLCRQGLGGEGT